MEESLKFKGGNIMKVLIIGDNISAGIRLIQSLLIHGCTVVVAGETEIITQLHYNNIVYHKGDISNRSFINRVFTLHKFQSVVFVLDKEKPFYQLESLNYFKESVSAVTYIMEQMVLYKVPSFILLGLNEKQSPGYEKTISAISTLLDWTEQHYGVHGMVSGEENSNSDEMIVEYILSTISINK